ncbi:MAG: hypothetical protein HC915_14205 [Anaerolineae bacterium]|nr:hypothetical protein [Anaerolineae bacterium]
MTDQMQSATAAQAYREEPQGPVLTDLLRPALEPQELGIPIGIVYDLVLKILFNEGEASLRRLGDVMKTHPQAIDKLVEQMQQEHLVEIARAGAGRFTYVFRLTDAGASRARDAFDRSQYVGPAPIPITVYNQSVLMQSLSGNMKVTPDEVKAALSHLILPDTFHRSIGPAINGGTSLFLYGPPGNGKTTVAEAIGGILTGSEPIFMPYAVAVGGYIITVFDPIIHKLAETDPKSHPGLCRDTR